jgi:UDP-N-acetylglucosamine--N-acetylmuramyl-(pentapeptide) pyrophosphoryl-undecaprenol N-acetylglucosamine transferase
MALEILILAGGGGHTGYAYALAQELHGEASLSSLVPEGDKLSENRMNKFSEVDYLIKPRGPKTSTYEFTGRLAKAFARSIRKVPRKLHAVVSTGSNFCIPPALIAWLKGIPIINIESSVRFTKASKTAKILQPFSEITALQWEEQKKLLSDGVVVGPLLPRPEIEPWNGHYILITGGTYGHKMLFDIMKESRLANVVLQTGQVDPQPYIKAHPEWKIITLTENFHELVAGAEVVVTHFGSTILDSLVYEKPIVIVPNPEWTRTAGAEDAEYLARKVNAVLVSDITLENLLNAIASAKERDLPNLPRGAENLANRIIEMIGAEEPR